MASPGQIKLIHCLKSALKLDEEHYRAVLSGYGVQSSKFLPVSQAKDMIERLECEAIKVGKWDEKRRNSSNYEDLSSREGMATPKQLRYITGLWNEVSRAPQEKKRDALRHFLTNHFRISRLEWVPVDKVHRIIAAIKAMKKGGSNDVN